VRTLPDEGAWLLNPANPRHNSHDCIELMETNDRDDLTEPYRERKLARMAAKHDVKVTFK
jgi:hypothetical protein